MKNSNLFPFGDRVRVTSHGPFRGLNGTIRQVDTIVDDQEEPFCFYLIALERTTVSEAIWFEYHEVEFIGVPSLSSPSPGGTRIPERKQHAQALLTGN